MKTIFLTPVLLVYSVAFAQNVSTLNADLANCKANVTKLQEDNDYLRKSMNVLKPIKTVQQADIQFNLVGCEGNTREQSVTVRLSLTNRVANREFQFASVQAIDMQGNDFRASQINLGKGETRNKLFTDIPIMVTIKFTRVLPSIKILKLLNTEYYKEEDPGRIASFVFKDIDITWK